ncbi:phospholipase D family protein, partial [bacterium]|nr:phospholipase D family protein [bacterium]
MEYKFLLSPWKNEFIDVISKTSKKLFVSSPFINIEGVRILSDAVQKKSSIEISLITNLTTKNIVNGITEPAALLELYKQFARVKISSLGRLHAKVYIIDEKIGIITSANLTSGGLMNNFEYGVLIDNKSVISTIQE